MRGTVVIVRAFGDVALVRRVWDVGDGVVYVTDDEGFKDLSSGKKSDRLVGFPAEDIFVYQHGIANESIPSWTALDRLSLHRLD